MVSGCGVGVGVEEGVGVKVVVGVGVREEDGVIVADDVTVADGTRDRCSDWFPQAEARRANVIRMIQRCDAPRVTIKIISQDLFWL